MDAYIYCADIHCADCGESLREEISERAEQQGREIVRESSDDWPQGPHADGGGEADCPQHCGACGAFLENPLTQDGYEYVRNALLDADGQPDGVARLWADYYDVGGCRDCLSGEPAPGGLLCEWCAEVSGQEAAPYFDPAQLSLF